MIYVDIAKFKELNDRYGQSAGDSVIAQFAHQLKSRVRHQASGTDVVGRIGGDEFAILIVGKFRPTHNAALIRRLRRPYLIEIGKDPRRLGAHVAAVTVRRSLAQACVGVSMELAAVKKAGRHCRIPEAV